MSGTVGSRWATPGAAAGVLLWLLASASFSLRLESRQPQRHLRVVRAAIVLVLAGSSANIALLFGAELNAEIEREQELAEVPAAETGCRKTSALRHGSIVTPTTASPRATVMV